MMAAKAEPEFMMPLAVPEACGAISIGTAHIGPMVHGLADPRLNGVGSVLAGIVSEHLYPGAIMQFIEFNRQEADGMFAQVG